jgi:hypothetical protein
VQLAALALLPAAPSGALLENFISDQAQTFAPVTQVVGDAPDIATALVTTPRTFVRVVQPSGSPTQPIRATAESVIDPAISSQVVNNTALASTIEPIDVFGLIFAAGFVVFFVVGIAVQYVSFIILTLIFGPCCDASGLAVSGASTPTVEEQPPAAPRLKGDPVLGDSSPDITATDGQADAARATDTGKADVSPPVTSTNTPTHAEQVASMEPATANEQMSTDTATSTKDVTETEEADEAATGPTAAGAPEASASASTSESAKPTLRPTTPRPVVRGSLEVGEQPGDMPHRGNGGHATTPPAAVDDGATTAGRTSVASSTAAPSSKVRTSSGGDSSGGDTGGS